jgi:hypothetical protein
METETRSPPASPVQSPRTTFGVLHGLIAVPAVVLAVFFLNFNLH